ncbi:MAG TPA: hypothetical protein VG276_30065 [Actinomycetes bacterium]|jgi:hypothetical protein|nr:hypothetical protein [Actinomycetes bacterium]
MPRPSLPSGHRAAPGLRWPYLLLAALLLLALASAGYQVLPSAKAAGQTSASSSAWSSATTGAPPTTAQAAPTTSPPSPGDPTPSTTAPSTAGGPPTTAAAQPPATLATSCSDSALPPHDGFEQAPRCVATDAGEVPTATPAVLLARFPRQPRAGQPFQVTISTRNLVRDRFLKAAEGGYYREMSVLDPAGIVRGHLHLYVQALRDGASVPDADTTPLEFFRAVEDGGGGAGLSRVSVSVNALTAGPKRLCVTMGDGSHRVPLMRAAKLAAGIDCVRILVR